MYGGAMMGLTHEEVQRVLLVLLHHTPHEELTAEQLRGHEGAILGHADLVRTELHPVCRRGIQWETCKITVEKATFT